MSKVAASDVAGSSAGGRGKINSYGINQMKKSQVAQVKTAGGVNSASNEVRNLME
jgi:hypothetical protein